MRQTAETMAEAAAARQMDDGVDRCEDCGATCGAELETGSQLSCTTCQQRIVAEFNPANIRLIALERAIDRAIH